MDVPIRTYFWCLHFHKKTTRVLPSAQASSKNPFEQFSACNKNQFTNRLIDVALHQSICLDSKIPKNNFSAKIVMCLGSCRLLLHNRIFPALLDQFFQNSIYTISAYSKKLVPKPFFKGLKQIKIWHVNFGK